MSQTATTSPQHPSQHPSARPAANTPSSRQHHNTSAHASAMPPFFSPRLPTPQQSAAQSAAQSAKSPSPNYFGFQSHDAGGYMNNAPQHPQQNWHAPSSAIHSTAAASPSVMPHDQNPDYAAFMKNSQGKSFQLGDFNGGASNFGLSAPPPPRMTASPVPISKDNAKPVTGMRDSAPPASRSRDMLDPASAELSQSPKRMLSPGSMTYPEVTRRGSPPSEHLPGKHQREGGSPDRHPRVKLPLDRSFIGSAGMAKHRAETLPMITEPETQLLTTPQHIVNLISSADEQILILDLRVSTQYAQSHVRDALNLCIPTTLLKRPSFNVQKLADTFKDDEQRARFGNWRSSKYIIVYDNNSTQLKDATICLNMVKKFQAEGYKGTLYIIKGGISEFTKRFSSHVEADVDSQKVTNSVPATGADGPKVAPVIGGCPMPQTDKPANPFFGNIRQNMDLIGGVGQMPIKHPKRATKNTEQSAFPQWLKEASEEKDEGKTVSKRFEQIERREKKRMEDALSGQVTFEDGASEAEKTAETSKGVKIAGLGMGNKNRYNNIWPFEHSRVKLEDLPRDDCDYFNANYVQASLSHKSYISTQAPIPATFNDFWNVIWQQDVRVVVMLTAEQEGAQVKAHNYWDQKSYASLQLEFLSEKRASLEPAKIHRSKNRPSAARRSSTNPANVPLAPQGGGKDENSTSDSPFVTVRKFTLSRKDRPFDRMREITQLQFDSWPDFGAPAHPAHLFGLVEQTEAVVCVANKTSSRQPEAEGSRPVLVHCSAGCGRTGTFCTVSSVIDMLKRQRIQRLGAIVGQTPATPAKSSRTSPMQLTGSTPVKQSGQGSGGGGGGKDFFDSFSSLPKEDSKHSKEEEEKSSNDTGTDTVEGSWVGKDDVDLIEKTVEDFRLQRLSMVQSLRQFVLCYESIMEWLVEQEQGPAEVEAE